MKFEDFIKLHDFSRRKSPPLGEAPVEVSKGSTLGLPSSLFERSNRNILSAEHPEPKKEQSLASWQERFHLRQQEHEKRKKRREARQIRRARMAETVRPKRLKPERPRSTDAVESKSSLECEAAVCDVAEPLGPQKVTVQTTIYDVASTSTAKDVLPSSVVTIPEATKEASSAIMDGLSQSVPESKEGKEEDPCGVPSIQAQSPVLLTSPARPLSLVSYSIGEKRLSSSTPKKEPSRIRNPVAETTQVDSNVVERVYNPSPANSSDADPPKLEGVVGQVHDIITCSSEQEMVSEVNKIESESRIANAATVRGGYRLEEIRKHHSRNGRLRYHTRKWTPGSEVTLCSAACEDVRRRQTMNEAEKALPTPKLRLPHGLEVSNLNACARWSDGHVCPVPGVVDTLLDRRSVFDRLSKSKGKRIPGNQLTTEQTKEQADLEECFFHPVINQGTPAFVVPAHARDDPMRRLGYVPRHVPRHVPSFEKQKTRGALPRRFTEKASPKVVVDAICDGSFSKKRESTNLPMQPEPVSPIRDSVAEVVTGPLLSKMQEAEAGELGRVRPLRENSWSSDSEGDDERVTEGRSVSRSSAVMRKAVGTELPPRIPAAASEDHAGRMHRISLASSGQERFRRRATSSASKDDKSRFGTAHIGSKGESTGANSEAFDGFERSLDSLVGHLLSDKGTVVTDVGPPELCIKRNSSDSNAFFPRSASFESVVAPSEDSLAASKAPTRPELSNSSIMDQGKLGDYSLSSSSHSSSTWSFAEGAPRELRVACNNPLSATGRTSSFVEARSVAKHGKSFCESGLDHREDSLSSANPPDGPRGSQPASINSEIDGGIRRSSRSHESWATSHCVDDVDEPRVPADPHDYNREVFFDRNMKSRRACNNEELLVAARRKMDQDQSLDEQRGSPASSYSYGSWQSFGGDVDSVEHVSAISKDDGVRNYTRTRLESELEREVEVDSLSLTSVITDFSWQNGASEPSDDLEVEIAVFEQPPNVRKPPRSIGGVAPDDIDPVAYALGVEYAFPVRNQTPSKLSPAVKQSTVKQKTAGVAAPSPLQLHMDRFFSVYRQQELQRDVISRGRSESKTFAFPSNGTPPDVADSLSRAESNEAFVDSTRKPPKGTPADGNRMRKKMSVSIEITPRR